MLRGLYRRAMRLCAPTRSDVNDELRRENERLAMELNALRELYDFQQRDFARRQARCKS
jgi:hypothetical protein